MNNTKCQECPLLAESRRCPGQKSRFVCGQALQPGLIAQLRSFAVAAVKHVAAGMPMATEEQKAARFAICVGCEHFDAERGGCRKCGCTMDIKAGWADSTCPLNPPKWGPIVPDAVEPALAPVEPAMVEPATV